MRMTHLEVNTQALLHNLKRLQARAPNSQFLAMVKANAYGCGLEAVTKVLSGQVGAFGVACVFEAMAIRQLGILDPIIVLEGAHQPEEIEIAANLGIELIVYHQAQIDWIKQHSCKKPLKIWIKINTGMNRLGFRPQALELVHQQLQQIQWVDKSIGLMTHFACADEPEHALHQHQIRLWEQMIKAWQGPVSACNSAALFSSSQYSGTLVRSGIALYGVSPMAGMCAQDFNLKPVMRFYSSVLSVFEVEAGEYIGYGATHQFDTPAKIAIVAVGYGDGYPRHIEKGTLVLINGKPAPIVGRVSMDKITIDVTQYPSVVMGDLVELWGENLPIEYVAKQSGTIAYELMCQVGPRERMLNLYLNR
jgi:alanine racemase